MHNPVVKYDPGISPAHDRICFYPRRMRVFHYGEVEIRIAPPRRPADKHDLFCILKLPNRIAPAILSSTWPRKLFHVQPFQILRGLDTFRAIDCELAIVYQLRAKRAKPAQHVITTGPCNISRVLTGISGLAGHAFKLCQRPAAVRCIRCRDQITRAYFAHQISIHRPGNNPCSRRDNPDYLIGIRIELRKG